MDDTITKYGYSFPNFKTLQSRYNFYSRRADRCSNPVLRSEWVARRMSLVEGYLIGTESDLTHDSYKMLSEMLHDGYVAACEQRELEWSRAELERSHAELHQTALDMET